jgi:hypothetical protein
MTHLYTKMGEYWSGCSWKENRCAGFYLSSFINLFSQEGCTRIMFSVCVRAHARERDWEWARVSEWVRVCSHTSVSALVIFEWDACNTNTTESLLEIPFSWLGLPIFMQLNWDIDFWRSTYYPPPCVPLSNWYVFSRIKKY